MASPPELDGPGAVADWVHSNRDTGINPGDPMRLKLAKRLVPHSQRDRLRRVATALVRRRATATAAGILARGDVRLNLGSGYTPIEGWTNIDLVGAPTDLAWDLAHGIPFPDGSVAAVYTAHVLEHLRLEHGLALFGECRRVLAPGGVLRVVVPDAGAMIASYSGLSDNGWAEDFPSPMLAPNALFYEHGHSAMFDARLMCELVRAAGLVDVDQGEFGVSRIEPCPDELGRRDGSLYVEGVAPGSP